MQTGVRATVEDLYHAPDDGKYELVHGRLVRMPPTGFRPGRLSGDLYASLRADERATGNGFATPDNVGYLVDLPHRQSFNPDAAFTRTPPQNRERFVVGAPLFAIEVRSEHDHTPAAERAYAAKRDDYFRAGTALVWDVNPRTRTITAYAADAPRTSASLSR